MADAIVTETDPFILGLAKILNANCMKGGAAALDELRTRFVPREEWDRAEVATSETALLAEVLRSGAEAMSPATRARWIDRARNTVQDVRR